MGLIYALGKASLGMFLRFKYKVRVDGHENIPRKGAFILCSNHQSFIDPMILAASVKRTVHFLAKKELMNTKFKSFFLNGCKVIPVDRSATDMQAYKMTLAALNAGEAVGIFSQGTRLKDVDTKDAKSGVALFALKSGAPVIPVYITTEYIKGQPVYINIGKPINLEEYSNDCKKIKSDMLDAVTEKIMNEVKNLKHV